MAPRSFASFPEFWLFYLSEHRRPSLRVAHYFGTTLFIASWAVAAATRQPLYVLAGVAAVYACAWSAHLLVDGRGPATRRWPLWSAYADLRMFVLFLAGRLDAELSRLPPE